MKKGIWCSGIDWKEEFVVVSYQDIEPEALNLERPGKQG